MSNEKCVIDELGAVIACVKRAEQNIIGLDYSEKLEIVEKLVKLEGEIKAIQSGIKIPDFVINRDTNLRDIASKGALTQRSANILARAGYATLGDVMELSDDDLLKVRNMGKKSFEEIKAYISDFTKNENMSE